MSAREFGKKLGLFNIFSAGLVGLQHLLSTIQCYWKFSVSSFIVYVLLTIFMFFLSKWVLKSGNNAVFTSLFLTFNLLRLLVSIVFVFVYISVYKPPTAWFLIPFFSVYILFTIFEVHMLEKIDTVK